LLHGRAEYGGQIVSALSKQLTAEYGRGFSRHNLFRMIQFAEAFPDEQIVSSLMRQLSWNCARHAHRRLWSCHLPARQAQVASLPSNWNNA
jgi:hypothetical protein